MQRSVTSREAVTDERNCDAEWEARMRVSRDSVVIQDTHAVDEIDNHSAKSAAVPSTA